jgi:Flp pilus assembly protein TadD
VLAELQARGNAPQVDAPLAEALGAASKEPSAEAARALWYAGQIQLRAFRAIPAEQMDEKIRAARDLAALYARAGGMGGTWGVASLWKMGVVFQELAHSVESMAPPPEVDASQALEFKRAVEAKAAPLKKRAEEAFRECLTRAMQASIYGPATLGCRNRADSQELPEAVAASSHAAPPDAAQREVDRKRDAASLEALGLAYVAAQDWGWAQLTLSRAAELDPKRASVQNALGFALLGAGNGMDAALALQKALELDPSFDKAHANLASLKCRFGDREGSKQELARIRDSSRVRGADVDPRWNACVDALSRR